MNQNEIIKEDFQAVYDLNEENLLTKIKSNLVFVPNEKTIINIKKAVVFISQFIVAITLIVSGYILESTINYSISYLGNTIEDVGTIIAQVKTNNPFPIILTVVGVIIGIAFIIEMILVFSKSYRKRGSRYGKSFNE